MSFFLHKKNRYFITVIFSACIACIFIFTGSTGISLNNNPGKPVTSLDDSLNLRANFLFDQGKYIDASLLYRQSALIYKKSGKWSLYIQNLIDFGKCFRNLQQYSKADSSFTEAETYAKKYLDKDDLLFATLYTAQAYLCCATNDYDKSTVLAEEAIKIRLLKNKDTDSLLMYPYCVLGKNCYCNGKYMESISYYEKALYFLSFCKNQDISEKSNFQNSIGQALWKQGYFEKAIQYYNYALLNSLNNSNNVSLELPNNYLSNSVLYSEIGQYKTAIKYLINAENILIAKFSESKSILGFVRMHKAFNYLKTHDYKKVVTECKKACNDFQCDTINNKTYLSYVYYYMASGYSGLNKHTEAIKYLSKCIKLKKELTQNYDPNSYLLLAKAYEKTGQAEKSDSTYNTIIEYLGKKQESQNHLLANILLNYGTFCLDNNKQQKALASYSEALKICLGIYGYHNLNTTTAYNDLGKLWAEQNGFDKSLSAYQLALASQINSIDSINIYQNPSDKKMTADVDLLNTLKGKGHAFYMLYKTDTLETNFLQASLKSYNLAVAVIDKLKILYNNSESSAALAETENDTYDEAVKVAAALFNLTDSVRYFDLAFSYSEKSKSSSLLASIRNNDAFVAAKVPLPFQKLEKNIQQQIEQYKELLYEENKSAAADNKKIDYINSKITKLDSYNDYLVQYMEKSYPRYYNLKYNTSTTSVDTIIAKLSPDEIFIEYTLTSDKLLSFIITNKTRKIVTVPADTTLINSISAYLHCINNSETQNIKNCLEFTSASSGLYNKILKPLNIDFSGKKLVIIPDEQLYNVPFECLLYNNPSGKIIGYRDLPYLIKKASVSYAASGTLLYDSTNNNSEINNNLLAFAPSYSNISNITSVSDETTRSYLDSITPLIWSFDEVNAIHTVFDGDVFTGSDATLNNFRKNSGTTGIIHLAMHTFIDEKDPMYSKLVFDPDSDNNGFLNTYELYNMQINSQLSVLSACNTSAGKLVKGEGVLCLARGFIYAGCPSLVMTLWEINDKSGSDLMKSFYKYLSEGKAKDEALRLAKLDYITNSGEMDANPYYWAGYINFGNHEPLKLEEKSKTSQIAYICSISIISLFLLLFMFFRKRTIQKVLPSNCN
jgi:CHAT domain-containing protein